MYENNEAKKEEEESIEYCEASDYKYKIVYASGHSKNYTLPFNNFEGVRSIKI